jgi:hypothetical protein
MKPRIAVLVFSSSETIQVGRDGRSDYSHDGLGWNGLSKILKDLSEPYEYCSGSTMDEYEHVLCSLCSFHDVLNLVSNSRKERKCKLHIGGPACNNINPIIPYIDTANFGRCDLGKINRIISGDRLPSVWRREDDPDFSGQYIVDAGSVEGLGDDETSLGCRQKCAFCFYSYWNGYATKNAGKTYTSGFGDHEDFFQCLDWQKCIRGGVTALDGVTESTRLRVFKPITAKTIRDTLMRSNDVKTDTLLRAKVYGIVGYPWESYSEIEKFDLPEICKEVEGSIKNKILMRMHFSHFIPFQKTPLWNSAYNWNDYRQWCISHRELYSGSKIRVLSGGTFMGSPSLAAMSTVLQRAGKSDTGVIRSIASSKFQSMPSSAQSMAMRRELNRFFTEQDKESIPNIKTPCKATGKQPEQAQ